MRRIDRLTMVVLPILVLLALGVAPAERGPAQLAPIPSIGVDPVELMVIPSDTLGASAADTADTADTAEAEQVQAKKLAPEESSLADKVRKGICAVRIMTRVAAGLLGEWIVDEVARPD